MTNQLQYSVTDRRRGIGGSDVGAIFGLNKWLSLPRLWLQKTGRLHSEPPGETPEWLEWGTYLEQPIAARYSKRSGRRVAKVKGTLVHPEYDFMIGNPDRLQWDSHRSRAQRKGVLEVKTAMFGKLREWSGSGVPISYYLQLQHYLAITGLSWGSFAVLFGGNRLVQFDVPRDDATINLIIERAREFWDYVQRDVPPPMEAGAEWNKELVHFFPKPTHVDDILRLDSPEAQGKAARLLRLREQIKTREKEQDALESWFKLQLADHVTAQIASVAKISWKPGERKSLDLEGLRAELPSIAAAYEQTSPTRRFYLTALSELEPEEDEELLDVPLTVSARRIELD